MNRSLAGELSCLLFSIGMAFLLGYSAGKTRVIPARPAPPSHSTAARPAIEPHFAPGADPEAAVVALCDGATSEVRVMAYNFSAPAVAEALVRAKERGLDVAVVLDRKAAAEKGNLGTWCAERGVAVTLDGHHPIMHDKIVITDRTRVALGSYNFSRQAHRNAENLVIVADRALARDYLAHWQRHHDEE